MLARYTFIDPSYWKVNGSNLENSNIFNQPVSSFILNPVTVNTLGGTKTSTFTPAQVNTNFKSTLTSAVSIPNAADFTQATFLSNGWTVGTEATLVTEIAQFLWKNLHNTTINPLLNDINVVIVKGNISGTDYIVPFCYFGNQGTGVTVLDDIYGDMLFTDVTFEFLYGDALLTDVTFTLTIDGDVW